MLVANAHLKHMGLCVASSLLLSLSALSPREETGRKGDRKLCMWPMGMNGGRPPGDRLW